MSNEFQDASQDGVSVYDLIERAIGVYNGTSIDRLRGTNGQVQIYGPSLTAGAGGASVNANPYSGVVYQNNIPLQASFTVGPLDVSLYRTLVIDWNITGTFTGTSIALVINSIDESGTSHAINSAVTFTGTGSATFFLGTGANPPGTNATASSPYRYPDPFRRKVSLVFTQTAMSALSSTISVVGE